MKVRDDLVYLKHIIDVKSEVQFIEGLEKYLEDNKNVCKEVEWWMFSKIDETLDNVYLPYYNSDENEIAKFKPDFIFWIKKGSNYLILFVDPKGTQHTTAYHKIEGYKRIFENKGIVKYKDLNVTTRLLLKPARGGIAGVPEEYREYWFDNFDNFGEKIIEYMK